MSGWGKEAYLWISCTRIPSSSCFRRVIMHSDIIVSLNGARVVPFIVLLPSLYIFFLLSWRAQSPSRKSSSLSAALLSVVSIAFVVGSYTELRLNAFLCFSISVFVDLRLRRANFWPQPLHFYVCTSSLLMQHYYSRISILSPFISLPDLYAHFNSTTLYYLYFSSNRTD